MMVVRVSKLSQGMAMIIVIMIKQENERTQMTVFFISMYGSQKGCPKKLKSNKSTIPNFRPASKAA